MNVLNLIGHIGLLIHIGKDIQGIVDNIAQKKESFPTEAEFKSLLNDAIDFINADIVGLPADVKATILKSLKDVKEQLWPSPIAITN